MVEHVRRATEQDVARALLELHHLPRRASENARADLAKYMVALEGDAPGAIVTAEQDLAVAVRRIIQGALGHVFFPLPGELRTICNQVCDERIRRAAPAVRAERMRAEAEAWQPLQHTKAQRDRVAAIYMRFCQDHERQKRGSTDADEVELIRAKYDPVVLAMIPDRPSPT
jgi:hypothetical protein